MQRSHEASQHRQQIVQTPARRPHQKFIFEGFLSDSPTERQSPKARERWITVPAPTMTETLRQSRTTSPLKQGCAVVTPKVASVD